jgi:hypothetical protein
MAHVYLDGGTPGKQIGERSRVWFRTAVKPVLFVLVLAACSGSGSVPESGSASASASAPAPAVDPAQQSPVQGAVVAPAVDAAPADERCADPCRFLDTAALADVAAAYAGACAGAPWPAPAANDCDALDLQRNCIYAVHGYTFSKARWRDTFTPRPWYRARADFRESDLGKVGTANVSALRQRAKECRAGNAITSADRARVEAFFATIARGKPALPPVVIDNLEVVTADALAPMFARPASYRLQPSTPMTYIPPFDELRAALPKQRLRVVRVDLSGCERVAEDECENSFWIDLAFDDKDVLVALRHGLMG